MTAPLPDFYPLRIKDITNLMGLKETAAKQILKDIKEHFETPKVLFEHFKRYFKL